MINKADNLFVNKRHIDTLMVCVKKDHQGQGIASELVEFAKRKAKIDNGVTRYCLCYNTEKRS